MMQVLPEVTIKLSTFLFYTGFAMSVIGAMYIIYPRLKKFMEKRNE